MLCFHTCFSYSVTDGYRELVQTEKWEKWELYNFILWQLYLTIFWPFFFFKKILRNVKDSPYC